MMSFEERVREYLTNRFADMIIREDNFRDQMSLYIKPEAIHPVCEALLENSELDIRFLTDITSLDWLGHEQEKDGRFEVVYNLYSISNKFRLLLKVRLDGENPKVTSLTPLWDGANWMEREVYDLMGVEFEGHPNLKRILTPDDFEGFPLRKDYPLTYEEPQFTWNKDNPPEVIK